MKSQVVDQAEITSIEAMLLKSQMTPEWCGGHWLLKIAQYGKLSRDYRDRGAPKKLFKDPLKKNHGTCHIDHYLWSTLAADR